MMILFVYLSLSSKVFLPEAGRIASIIMTDDSVYMLDSSLKAAHLLSGNGVVMKTFAKVGAGPGEWQEPVRMRRGADGRIYVLDLRKSAVFVFSAGLDFLEEFRVGGLCRDIVVIDEDWFVLSYDPAKETMIKQFTGRTHKLVRSFAKGLAPKDVMFGFQTGFLGTDGSSIYIVRLLNANIEAFNRDGVLLRTLQPNGVEVDFLSKSNVKDPNFWNDIRYSVASFKVNGQWLSLVVHDKQAEKKWEYRYDLSTRTWRMPRPYKVTYETPSGEIFELVEVGDQYQLVRIKSERSNP